MREDGPIVVCGDDPKLAEVARGASRAVTTYGFSRGLRRSWSRAGHGCAQGVGTRFTPCAARRARSGQPHRARTRGCTVSNGAAVPTLTPSLRGLDVDLAAVVCRSSLGHQPPFRPVGESRVERPWWTTTPINRRRPPLHRRAAKAPGFQTVRTCCSSAAPRVPACVALFTDIMRDHEFRFGGATDEGADTVTFSLLTCTRR
ncbi:MAG: hypothetical protein ACLTDR_08525 [Adlercreutzia equolifaciens]